MSELHVTILSDRSIKFAVGTHTIAIITPATPKLAVEKFDELCRTHEKELANIGKQYEEKRDWNLTHPGKGKDWPIFRLKDRVVSRLLREAGVKDS